MTGPYEPCLSWLFIALLLQTERKPNNYATIDATITQIQQHFSPHLSRQYSGVMPPNHHDPIPSTPLRIFRPKAGFRQGPFYVRFEDLDHEAEFVDIADGESKALAKDPPGIVLFAMLSGVGFTTLAGRAMRLNFRHAAENFYLGKKRRLGALTVAAISNLILAGLYTVVDAIGLMKASGVMAQIAALNGSKPAGSSVDIAYIVAAGAFSITYTAYSSISGWMEARTSAANRITKACEDESIESIKEVQASDGFAGAIAALNAVRVDDVAAVQVEDAYERALGQISKEREAIVAKLIVPVDCTEEEALLLERARTEAEGRQMEFDRLIATLRDQLTNGTSKDSGGDARAGMSGPRDNSRLGSMLRGAISRLSGPGERAT